MYSCTWAQVGCRWEIQSRPSTADISSDDDAGGGSDRSELASDETVASASSVPRCTGLIRSSGAVDPGDTIVFPAVPGTVLRAELIRGRFRIVSSPDGPDAEDERFSGDEGHEIDESVTEEELCILASSRA